MIGFFKKLFGNQNNGANTDTGIHLEPDLTITRANNELQLRTQAAVDLWGLDTASWAVDLDSGIITFTNDEKGMVITAPVQIVGTYNTEDGTWLWGWEHPSVSESLGTFARRVRDFGEQYGREELTTRKITTSMDTAWEFTALACYLSNGEGAYNGSSGTTRVLMVFGSVTIHKND